MLLIVGGASGVTVQVEGMGTIAGPPARGVRLDVGRAEAREQNAAVAAAAVKMVRMMSVVMTNSRNNAAGL